MFGSPREVGTGPGWTSPDAAERMADRNRRETLLDVARMLIRAGGLGCSAHFLAIAQLPGQRRKSMNPEFLAPLIPIAAIIAFAAVKIVGIRAKSQQLPAPDINARLEALEQGYEALHQELAETQGVARLRGTDPQQGAGRTTDRRLAVTRSTLRPHRPAR